MPTNFQLLNRCLRRSMYCSRVMLVPFSLCFPQAMSAFLMASGSGCFLEQVFCQPGQVYSRFTKLGVRMDVSTLEG